MKPLDFCPHCTEHQMGLIGKLKLVRGDEPYNIDHLYCPECGSTYTLDFRPMWQEEINSISGDVCDFVQSKLTMFENKLSKEKEDELFDLIVNYLDEFGYGDYKNYN